MLILNPAQQILCRTADNVISFGCHHTCNRTGKMGLTQAGLPKHKEALTVRIKLFSIVPAEIKDSGHDKPRVLPALRVDNIRIKAEVKVLKAAFLKRRRSVQLFNAQPAHLSFQTFTPYAVYKAGIPAFGTGILHFQIIDRIACLLHQFALTLLQAEINLFYPCKTFGKVGFSL